MSIVRLLGSFPNSQIKPRSPVRENDTDSITVPASPSFTTILTMGTDLVKAIVINEGPNPIEYVYNSSSNFATAPITLNVGDSMVFEDGDGGSTVIARGIGGSSEIVVDERTG